MKRTTIYRRLLLLAAVPALVLAACTKDDALTDDGNDNGRTPVLFTAAIQSSATRTAPGTDGAQTMWKKGDQIGVFMLPKGGKIPADTLPAAHNVPYEVDPATGELRQIVPNVYNPATDSWSIGVLTPIYYPSADDEVDFVAYYPYDQRLEIDNPNWLLSPYMYATSLVDQTIEEKQYIADLLYSDNACGIHRSKDAVELRFRHLMAKLRLDITLAEGLAGGKVTKVTLPGMPVAVEFDMRKVAVNKIEPWQQSAAPISCLPLPSPTAGTGAAATFTALVPPHSGADYPGRQITVTVDGEEYTGLLPDTDDYAGNTMYAYPVRVTPRGLTIDAPAGEVPWTDAQALPEGYDLTVANETELRRFAELVNAGEKLPNGTLAREAKVLQTADITLTQEWTPIGRNTSSVASIFRGTYNGDGHTITGLTITEPNVSFSGVAHAGLFGCVDKGILTGIHLREVKIDIITEDNIAGEFNVGSIAGSIINSTLSLCSAEGTVKVCCQMLSIYAGGIVGKNNESTISRCRASVETNTTGTGVEYGAIYAGGIAGKNDKLSFILSCEAQGRPVTAKATWKAYAGGIAGWNNFNSLIAFCRTGANDVTAQNGTDVNYAGGLVGNNDGYLYSCYSRATATATGGADNRAGAIVVNNHFEAVVQYCYGVGATGPGTSGLAADPGLGIYYETSPSSDAIFNVMKGYTGMVESIPGGTDFPYATRHTPAAYPAHGITPVRVKWGPGERVWQRGINTSYPEIDMEYDGEDNAVAP